MKKLVMIVPVHVGCTFYIKQDIPISTLYRVLFKYIAMYFIHFMEPRANFVLQHIGLCTYNTLCNMYVCVSYLLRLVC